jgi:cytochrome b
MTEPAPATVRLWDPLIRLCHWSLAIAFFANWFFTEEGEDWHQWLGYWAGAAALLRGASWQPAPRRGGIACPRQRASPPSCEHCVDGSRNTIWATQRSEPW